jgi:ceramide glucosyltransferase
MKRLAWLACPIIVLLVIGLIDLEGPLRLVHLVRLALVVLCGVGAVFGIAYTVLAAR